MSISFIDGHIDGSDRCVICGRDIPEGRQVCVICGYKAEQKKTNYDRIRNMSVEEMAEFIDKVERCKGKAFHNCDDSECYDCAGCVYDTKEWLESEVTE